MDAARGRFPVDAVEVIERAGTFPDGVTFLNCFGHVGFGEQHGFAERPPAGQARGNRGRESASRSVRIFGLQMIAAESQYFDSVKEDVDGLFHVAALDDHGARAPLEFVVNQVGKDKITGYLSVPKVSQPHAQAVSGGN